MGRKKIKIQPIVEEKVRIVNLFFLLLLKIKKK